MKKEENYFKDLEETIFSLYELVNFQQNEIRILYIVSFLLFLVANINSLSLVVNPVPVSIDIIWNLALSIWIPSILKTAENISIIIW